jgi:thioredoxin 1
MPATFHSAFQQISPSQNIDQFHPFSQRAFKMSRAKQVSLATFESEVLESSMPVVVDFYADWCAPCRMLGPVLDRVSTAFDGRAKIVKVNIDQEPALAQQFNVSSIPTLTFVLRGEVVAQSAGMPSESELSAVVQQMVDLN